jgi:hypothetical protein
MHSALGHTVQNSTKTTQTRSTGKEHTPDSTAQPQATHPSQVTSARKSATGCARPGMLVLQLHNHSLILVGSCGLQLFTSLRGILSYLTICGIHGKVCFCAEGKLPRVPTWLKQLRKKGRCMHCSSHAFVKGMYKNGKMLQMWPVQLIHGTWFELRVLHCPCCAA